jgi:sugar phosphate isomerase/epimerase
VEACVALGRTDLHVVTGTYADRFRADVPWAAQLAAIRDFLGEVAPMLADLGVRLDVETHEETTTVELLRLIEEFGPDRIGLTFDTGNVIVQGEDPVTVSRTIAPYVRQTHVKDAVLFFDETAWCGSRGRSVRASSIGGPSSASSGAATRG